MYGFTRGERNCNPGNIRKSGSCWVGKIIPSRDPDFEQFDTSIDGIRALAKLLLTYYKKYELNTVQSIISKWAPGNENNTAAYIGAVSAYMAVGSADVLDLNDLRTLANLTEAIIEHENGQMPYSVAEIDHGVSEALV